MTDDGGSDGDEAPSAEDDAPPTRDGAPAGEDETPAADPFERLGGDEDREGDPFERLDADGAADGTGSADAPDDADGEEPVREDPWVPPGTDRREDAADEWRGPAAGGESARGDDASDPEDGASRPADGDAHADDAPGRPADPFEDVETPAGSPFDDESGVFERVEVGPADPDDVWETIVEGDDDQAAATVDPDESRYSEVSKHRFCEHCEHFSGPPEVSCGHERAEIVEFLDMETVRLRDCPVVAEREALERRE